MRARQHGIKCLLQRIFEPAPAKSGTGNVWASLAVVLLVLVHAIRTRHDVSAGSRTTVPRHNTHNSAGEPMVQLAEVICTTGEPR